MRDDTTEEQVREAFEDYGTIKQIDLVKDRNTGKLKGFGFVTFDDYDPVDKAVRKLLQNCLTAHFAFKHKHCDGAIYIYMILV